MSAPVATRTGLTPGDLIYRLPSGILPPCGHCGGLGYLESEEPGNRSEAGVRREECWTCRGSGETSLAAILGSLHGNSWDCDGLACWPLDGQSLEEADRQLVAAFAEADIDLLVSGPTCACGSLLAGEPHEVEHLTGVCTPCWVAESLGKHVPSREDKDRLCSAARRDRGAGNARRAF